jgi:hypothetical protein
MRGNICEKNVNRGENGQHDIIVFLATFLPHVTAKTFVKDHRSADNKEIGDDDCHKVRQDASQCDEHNARKLKNIIDKPKNDFRSTFAVLPPERNNNDQAKQYRQAIFGKDDPHINFNHGNIPLMATSRLFLKNILCVVMF